MAVNPTVGACIEQIAGAFSDAKLVFAQGTDNAWDEAVWLVLRVTDLPDSKDSLAHQVPAAAVATISELAQRRIHERVPLAYLLGEAYFCGLPFAVEPGVIVPRSPLAELIQQQFRPWLTKPPELVLDMCTGSGCIGIATAMAFPDAQVWLVDVDSQAVQLAHKNLVRHGLANRVRVLKSDLLQAVPVQAFDLVLSNPPYVSSSDMSSLPPELQAEPALALAAGETGLDVLLPLLDQLPAYVHAESLIVLEAGRSAPDLLKARPELPFIWPELTQGGEGVVLLAGASVNSHTVAPQQQRD